MTIDLQELSISILYIVLHLYQGLKKLISCNMALTFNSPPPISSLSPNLSWVGQFFVPSCGGGPIISQSDHDHDQEEYDPKILEVIDQCHGNLMTTNESTCFQENVDLEKEEESSCLGMGKAGEATVANKPAGGIKLRKRPSRLVVPEYSPGHQEFGHEKSRRLESKEFEVEGRDFSLAAKKGRREVMEDGYGVLLDIMGDPKQAFFAVIDGHGGRAATDYVAENLGRNIVKGIEHVKKEEDHHQIEETIHGGYLATDKGFLSQGVSSGACAASVLLRDGHLHVANVGDCRVVLSRKGIAHALTKHHRLTRQDERLRIENSGGFVQCCNGVWRVQGTLAVSRAIGDQHLKEWVISDPEIKSLPLTSDCEFLILASDGLWDKVDDQEAVDVVQREDSSVVKACKTLVDMSSSRGIMDDITVMVINLQGFMTTSS
ncbi:probable protein phosphatase 2C 2 isoform X1 [Morus notabilis]|uniref:probable protein phosphatase 2C 2 isoform X1 n=1 Tax=Morus notabilis TaxID=981085 RepID=UPI000CECEE0E|nr:probable protein phosphatase 2C 2 isoform X1 [Morus notabilis]